MKVTIDTKSDNILEISIEPNESMYIRRDEFVLEFYFGKDCKEGKTIHVNRLELVYALDALAKYADNIRVVP